MRIRTIKPEFWTDQRLRKLSIAARLCYIGTWNLADDAGNLIWDADYIKATIFMSDDIDVAAVMAELVDAGRIEPYEADDATYASVVRWKKHQVINRPSPRRHPVPLTTHSLHTHGVAHEKCVKEVEVEVEVEWTTDSARESKPPVDNPSSSSDRHEAVVDNITDRIMKASPGVEKPVPYRRGIQRNVKTEMGERIAAMIARHPDWDVNRVATEILATPEATAPLRAVFGAQLHRIGPTDPAILAAHSPPEEAPDIATVSPLAARALKRALS